MKFSIYHAKPTFDANGRFSGTTSGFGQNQTTFPDDYEHVADVNVDNLDDAFALTQNYDRPWTDKEGVTARRELPRSTSVGDVIVRHDPEHGAMHALVLPWGFQTFLGNTVPPAR